MAEEADDISINMDSAVDEIGSDLGFESEKPEAEAVDSEVELEVAEDPVEEEEKPVVPPEIRAAPKAWAKEQHERWAKLDKDTQDYIELREKQMLDGLSQYGEAAKVGNELMKVMAPYKALIQAQGVDEAKAVQFLLNAHYRLSNGQPDERKSYFMSLAKSYGINVTGAEEQAQVDPNIAALQQKVERLESSLTAREQQALNDQRAKVAKEVEEFAADKKHPYFDECHEDIVAYINAGHTLESAYEKAVYANPVTRAKEIARLQTENDAALRAKAKKEADAKRQGTRTNVNSKDTTRAPTAPKGNWEDTLNETYKEIQSRTH